MNSYFKYCPIYSHDALEKEYSLINLFSNQVSFSRRDNFNDLFDSKVNFEIPSRERVRRTYQKLSGHSKRTFKQLYMGSDATKNFVFLYDEMNKILDDYLFYCLTDNPTNNLMWSHYANSHNGFCIEWDANQLKPEKVQYQEKLPSLDILELIESTIGLRSEEELGIQAWHALKVKLSEWEYEQEYRFNLGKNAKHLIAKDFGNFALVESQPEWIKSIVFGYRMPEETRNYIRSKLDNNMIFKEIVIAPNKNHLRLQLLA
ncbi:DUF2971 domain-containing protein [Photobacterium frigidiphilum]|uniref:DUF2971 domain-containing protein n=1 Tax=Photobacterium frigidiphilum TaxID=264736 RepID=UPI003D13D63F